MARSNTIQDHVRRLLKRSPSKPKTTRFGFAIYYLIDPYDQKVRWVGCTSAPSERLTYHLDFSNPGTREWIASLLPERPILKVQCVVETQQEGERIEKVLIEIQRKRSASLLNAARYKTGGTPGDGAFNKPQELSSKRLLRAETKEEARARRKKTREQIEQGARMSEIDK